jgi:hypothetical protein
MAPFLCNTIFNEKSFDPLELIILAWEAAIEFDDRNRGTAGFKNASAMDHVIAFTNWAFTIHLGNLKEARLTMDTNNNKIQACSDFRHVKCILSPLGAMGTLGATGQSGHLEQDIFKSLGKGLKQMG